MNPPPEDASVRTDGLDVHDDLELVSHHLCPYVQRAVIALTEKNVPHARRYIDLANKPVWFTAISPLGKVPLLRVRADDGIGSVLFESAVVCEFLEDTRAPSLHPTDPLDRARHRAWIEFASSILDDIADFYNAGDARRFESLRARLASKFDWLEQNLGAGRYFAGAQFSLVDAAFGPLFRYFDTFDLIEDFHVFDDTPKVRAYRAALSRRRSVRDAVADDYPTRLMGFLHGRGSHFSTLIRTTAA